MLIRSGEARLVGWSRLMLYSGFNNLPRSVFWSANLNGRSDNTDVIRLKQINRIAMSGSKHPFRFKLSTVLLLVVPVAILSLFLSAYYDNQPIQWQAYSKAVLQKHLANRKTVLVFFTATWDPTAQTVEEKALETSRIRRLLRRRGIIPLRADCSDMKINARDELVALDFPPTPVIAIYFSGQAKDPEILGDLVTENALYSALTNIETK